MFRTNNANRTTADVTDAITADAGATHTRRPRRAGALTASAAAALALTAGGAAPAVAAPAADAAPAAEAAADPTGDSRLKEAIGQATRDGHISAGHEWVADPWFPVARGTDGSVSAQVITVAGATGSSPQAVLLYGPNDGGYVGTAAVPEGFGADRTFGDRTGQVESVSVIGMDAVKVTWKGPDGQSKDVTYRQP
ncbi:hypothetical protein ACFORJ_00410 [Corynebacterium hansenii]|uniref:Secreted protein n=1 Tax=Corynebacterium hansenii TaxID=394964 RepID=A0ABV7ZMY2_9CORY|nr:hypothetical protein [Corynebacterium hansenii]WJY99538.1 hypothetical protein CHAN_04575 [Corynebacterium hansenii]